jgi:hypothetical protein
MMGEQQTTQPYGGHTGDVESSHIRGLPTLMAIYGSKLEAGAPGQALRAAGYAPRDVLVYYRIKGTDQVVYADSGRIAPGQALDEAHITDKASDLETVVLMHPAEGDAERVKGALATLGPAQIMYEPSSLVSGRESGELSEVDKAQLESKRDV